ncbi:MAG: alpha-glucan family phosphorylase [Luteibaculaceae bacterium]
MSSIYSTWHHPYKPAKEFSKKVAYFSMEFGIDQALKIYSGGLGFLAGSHMRSAYELKQNLIGIGILWKYGYYDQMRNQDQTLRPTFIEKNYPYLEDTGISFDVSVFGNNNVKVKVFCLKAETFGSAPIYLLSTDVPENDHLSKTITHHLYDNNESTRIAQSIVLGVGGAKLIDLLGGTDVYHLNEGHALPAFTYLYGKAKTAAAKKKLKQQCVFTTHTPEKAGNEEHSRALLEQAGFFGEMSEEDIDALCEGTPGILNYTVAALRLARLANGVSKLHAEVANDMWKSFDKICKIIPITNSQNFNYWADKELYAYLDSKADDKLLARKKELKKQLFEEVADQTGKIFSPDVLTIVWARRFASYKRPDLLLRDFKRFEELITNQKYPVQIIWAGKPYPKDQESINTFNRLVQLTKKLPNCAVLVGYELKLSHLLKDGCDIWLNTPRKPREASGTSGMTASMNGGVNFSIKDGWMPEYGEHGKNCFFIEDASSLTDIHIQDHEDHANMFAVLENEILPCYYDAPAKWTQIMKNSMADVIPAYTSKRMATEYYQLLFNAK